MKDIIEKLEPLFKSFNEVLDFKARRLCAKASEHIENGDVEVGTSLFTASLVLDALSGTFAAVFFDLVYPEEPEHDPLLTTFTLLTP